MTRIAVLADIHGNMPALEAVLSDIAEQGPDEVLVGGDLVGRGPQGDAVVRRIRELGWRCVRGNHEDYLLGFHRREVPEEWWDAEEWAASRWMAAELSEASVAFISALPFTINAERVPQLALYHGSPRAHNEGLGVWTEDALLIEHLAVVDGDLLVCAHTHRPMDRALTEGRVVNVGSVGLPFNGDTRAQYAIFTREPLGGWSVAFRRVRYDVEATLEIYARTGFLEQGDVTARLLKMELERARPFLVPFLKWADLTEHPRVIASIEAFLDVYDPEAPMHTFFARIQSP